MQQLKNGTTLQSGKYKIISMLGRGGFGITYLAEQTMLERNVAIKEFFMKEFCERDGATSHVTLGTESSRETVSKFREKFIKEARNIAKLKHPNIVSIIDVFEENGTAYYVMEYCEHGTLADKVKNFGYLSESVATRYILQVAEALEYIHQRKMNHLDVKPANIMLNEKDESVLIDFGLSKQYDAGGQQTSTTPVGISEGYAPMEQYKKGGVGEFSPQTDIYALGATFYKLLSGKTPPSASDVYEDGVPLEELRAKGVSPKAIYAICNAMKSRKKERTQSASLFIAGLKGTMPPIPKPAPIQEDDEATVVNVANKGSVTSEDKTFTVGGVTFKMIYVQGGTFTMGATSEQGADARDNEKPAYKVTLSDYYIGKTEVTQALWKVVMGKRKKYFGLIDVDNNPSEFKGDNLPVEHVSWYDCQEFIKKLNSLTGKKFRLPTEAEWEYAARGGSKSRGYKYSGSNNIDDVAWYDGNSGRETHEVGTKRPNELGIYDMSGNVYEWCSDLAGKFMTGLGIVSSRMYRGGSWGSRAWHCRSSNRGSCEPDYRNGGIGFRLCLSK